MNPFEHSPTEKTEMNFRTAAGGILVVSGAVLFLDRYLGTGWLSLLVMPCTGLFLYQWGLRSRYPRLITAGGILLGLGIGAALALNPFRSGQPWLFQMGYVAVCFALGCAVALLGVHLAIRQTVWWALVTGGAVGAVGLGLLYSPFRIFNFLFYVALGVGLPFIIWGTVSRLYGLIIAGCVITSTGAGLYFGWGAQAANGMLSTGIMLMWFAFGWALITFFSRVIFDGFAWWPLIPGGILAMVGFGLYVGGDPHNALGIIGNTGSITLMIFGLYLLLMRKGIHR